MALLRLALLACAACGAGQPHSPPAQLVPESELDPKAPEPIDAAVAPAKPTADHDCIATGLYNVDVDLGSATITQGDTGMADTTWCASMLQAVASQQMATMSIRYDGDTLAIEWPEGHAAIFDVTGPCDVSITSPPMPARLHFDGSKGVGTTSFSVATQHVGDTCTAMHAKLTIQK
ncbi:MAG TPA: hypothetical protein VGG74_23755 [Kofleriaceae bacterium]|jgi:hypothetical protein